MSWSWRRPRGRDRRPGLHRGPVERVRYETEPGRIPSPGGWTVPSNVRPAWNWTPPPGIVPRPDRAPRWVRWWYHAPLIDRYAYAWMWWHGPLVPPLSCADLKEGKREHGQGGLPVPGVVAADLIVVQAGLVLGGLEAFLDRPPGAGHGDQLGQGGAGRGVTGEVRQLGLAQLAGPDRHPVAAMADPGVSPITILPSSIR
jgi:hypothetical protein